MHNQNAKLNGIPLDPIVPEPRREQLTTFDKVEIGFAGAGEIADRSTTRGAGEAVIEGAGTVVAESICEVVAEGGGSAIAEAVGTAIGCLIEGIFDGL